MVTLSDPVNDAFTVEVPEGWDSIAYSSVEGQIARNVVNTVSPDGGTVIFAGDPKLPSYWEPSAANDTIVDAAEMLDSMEIRAYTPADEYVVEYVTDKFGEIEGFTMGDVVREPDREEKLREQAAAQGVPLDDIRVATARFTFDDDDSGLTNAAVSVGTYAGSGIWSVDVNGVATDGDLDAFMALANQVSASRKANPAFVETMNQRHEDTMAMIQQRTEEMTRQHEANMAWIQDSANAHQQRMQAIWDSNDAQMANYYDRMASGDVEHRQFLNYINDERTVLDSSGAKHQVDDSYQRYWMNPSTGSYVGGDINFSETQLRELGLNPSDYEEVQIVKG